MSRFGYEISVFKYTTGRYSEQPPEQPAHTSRMFLHGKMDVKIFLMFIVAENTGSVNIILYSVLSYNQLNILLVILRLVLPLPGIFRLNKPCIFFSLLFYQLLLTLSLLLQSATTPPPLPERKIYLSHVFYSRVFHKSILG